MSSQEKEKIQMELETYRKLKEEKCALEIRVKKEENEIKIFNNKIKELNQKVKQIKKGILVGGISLPIMSFIASIPPCIIINIPDKLLLFKEVYVATMVCAGVIGSILYSFAKINQKYYKMQKKETETDKNEKEKKLEDDQKNLENKRNILNSLSKQEQLELEANLRQKEIEESLIEMYYLLGESLQKFLEEQQTIQKGYQKEILEKQRQVLLSQKEQNQEQEMEYQRQLELAFKLGLKEQDPEMTSEYKEEIISCKEVLGLKMIKNEQI